MTPKLAPEARYRVIPHPNPNLTGGCGFVLDETAPLDEKKRQVVESWIAGRLHAVAPTGATTNAYANDAYDAPGRYENAPLYDVDGHLRALAPHLATMLHRPMVRTLAADDDRRRIFGLAADGTLVVAVATLDPDYLNEESAA